MLTQRLRLAAFRALHGKGLTKVPGLKPLADAIKRNRSRESIVHGFPVQLDRNDVLRLSVFGVYEPLETEIVKQHVKPGDTVLDLGGHIGYYSLLFSKLTGPTGRVFTFEPTPETYAILSGNLSRNSITNVTAINAAVADKSGEITLSIGENCGDNHIGEGDVSVRLLSIDDYLPRNQTVQFIKMDIQGAEPRALEGMTRTLERSKGVRMLVELWPPGLIRAGADPGAFLDRLNELGFTYRHIDRARKALVPRSRSWLLSQSWIMDKGTNLFCEKG